MSGWRVQSSGRRHRQVLVDAREHHRLAEGVAPLRRRRLERRLAVGDPVRVAGEHLAHLVVVAARPTRAVRSAISSEHGCWPYGKSEAYSTCSGETWRKKSSRSIGLQADVSKKTPALPAKWRISAPRSAIPAWAMISCASG